MHTPCFHTQTYMYTHTPESWSPPRTAPLPGPGWYPRVAPSRALGSPTSEPRSSAERERERERETQSLRNAGRKTYASFCAMSGETPFLGCIQFGLLETPPHTLFYWNTILSHTLACRDSLQFVSRMAQYVDKVCTSRPPCTCMYKQRR